MVEFADPTSIIDFYNLYGTNQWLWPGDSFPLIIVVWSVGMGSFRVITKRKN